MSKREPYAFPEPAAGAPVYWTSLEELHLSASEVAELQKEREKEFTDGASELSDPVSRRSFLSLMSAGIALATMQGCRRPVDLVLPYTRMPEEVTVGVPSHYATVYARNGEALGLLVESHEGRPTKIEGNPDHPVTQGSTDLITQASVLDLYDPDRSRQPWEATTRRTWNEFDRALLELIATHVGDRGARLRILAEPSISPTFLRLRNLVLERFPSAHFHTWSAVHTSNPREGARLAFGVPVNALHAFDHAKVVLSLDSDFLQTEPGMVRNTRAFAAGRRLHTTHDDMVRLYQVESALTTTGANADHRLRLASRDVESYVLALIDRLATTHHVDFGEVTQVASGHAAPAGVPRYWIDTVAADLASNRRGSIVLAGTKQPPTVHALVHALNAALDNVGHTLVYTHVADVAEPEQAEDLRALATAMEGGQVDTLVILGGNPVYDAPGDVDFVAKLGHVAHSIHLSPFRNETSQHTSWHAPLAHYLETWGDARAMDGTVSVQQPLIQPLYAGRSEIEILGMMADVPARRGYDLVQQTQRGADVQIDLRAFDRGWRRALNLGLVQNTSPVPMSDVRPRLAEIAPQVRAHATVGGNPIGRGNVEVVFLPDHKVFDGRHSNNAWLAELPDPITKIVWDNAAYVSPTTAHELGITSGDVLRLSKDGRSIRIVAWVLPGQADYSIGLPLGWGHTHTGRIANGKGFDVSPLRSSQAVHFMDGVEVTNTHERYQLVQTQEHHRMENRPIAIEATLDEYRELPHFAEHTRRGPNGTVIPGSPTPRTLPLWRGVQYNGHKWGMVIDLNACTGCNTCAIACQSENNVPVVGKDQVYRGREMHWLRVDRYFVGADERDPLVTNQPLMCVQCENAPCENVCPVNATTHSPEGLNDMAYNRCIGTRYCSNNCPYKVRRFNYLNWHNDGPYQPQDADVPESVRMQHNPNVSVRFRGVMEKCTYCVQRIQSKKIEAKRDNRALHDGEIVTACQQACPAQAITFGDLNDDRARVTTLAANDRRYKLLADLGTQPRTTYLAKVRNPNPEMHG